MAIELVGIGVGTPLLVLGCIALNEINPVVVPFGMIAVVSGGLTFHVIKKTEGALLAIGGALLMIPIVWAICIISVIRTFGS
jgi:hypothetical protein